MLLPGFVLSLTLWFGIGMDQAIYAYGAWVWKVFHLPPYIGVWDANYPGIFIIHRAALELFGPTIIGFRVFDFLAQLSCLCMIYYLAKKISGSGKCAFLVCLFYSFYYFGRGRWDAGQRDAFAFWVLLGAVFFSAILKNRTWLRPVLVGLAAGFAFLIRPTYGLSWPVLGIFLLGQGLRTRPLKIWLELLIFFLACMIPSIIVIIYYSSGGYLNELFRALLIYDFEVYSRVKPPVVVDSWLARPFFTLNTIFSPQPVIALLALFSVLIFFKGEDQGEGDGIIKLILAMVCAGLFSYLVLGKNLQYHLIPFWGFMIIISGVAVKSIGAVLEKNFPGAAGRSLAALFYLLLVVLMFASIPDKWTWYAVKHSFRDLESGYLSGVDVTDQLLSDNHYLTAKFLKDELRPGDQVEVFGAHPLVPFLIKRKLPSRFVCVQHLFFSPGRRPLSAMQKQWIREYTAAVISARPRFFVLADQSINLTTALSKPTYKQALVEQFPELKAFLENNYRPFKKIDQTEIYELLPDSERGRGGQARP